jgi:hypothetical protein
MGLPLRRLREAFLKQFKHSATFLGWQLESSSIFSLWIMAIDIYLTEGSMNSTGKPASLTRLTRVH